MKPKSKILKKALMYMGALTTSLAMFLSALSPQALAAVWGEGDGYLIPAKDGGFAWGQSGDVSVNSWRVTLYVSTKDDGTIDPATDAIGSGTLAKVGTIVYNNIFAIDSNADVFVSASEHAETRSANWKDYTCVSPVKAADRQISGSDHSLAGGGDKIYHNTDCPAELPKYGTYNNAPSGSDPFIEKVIEHLNNRLGGTLALEVAAKVGAEPRKVLTPLLEQVKNGTMQIDDALSLLLPTTSDSVVQWACVVEPLVERRTNTSGTFFEALVYNPDTSFYYGSYMIQVPGGPCQYMLLDAYETAQYNEASRKMYNPNESLYSVSAAEDEHIKIINTKTTILGLTTKTHPDSSCLERWGEYGQLAAEWGNLLANSATVCYDTHSGYSYCGVPVAGSIGPELNYWSTSASRTAATYGGIAVLISKLEDTEKEVPVYYYIYDENNNFVELKQETYTPDDNGFVPSTDYGIPIADESLNNSDQPLKSTTGGTRYFYYTDYQSLAGYVIDFKGTSAGEDLLNPSAVTDSIKTSNTVSGITTEAQSIHVKVIKVPSVDIYYHTYTYTVPDECWDEVNNALQGLEGLEYEKKLEELAEKFSRRYCLSVSSLYLFSENSAIVKLVEKIMIKKSLGSSTDPRGVFTIQMFSKRFHFGFDIYKITHNGAI